MEQYEITRPVYLVDDGILYPINHIQSGKHYTTKITYFDVIKDKNKIPSFLESGENRLDADMWDTLIQNREDFIDLEKGNLRFLIEMPVNMNDVRNKQRRKIQLQTDGIDIVIGSNIENNFGSESHIVSFKYINDEQTSLNYTKGTINPIYDLPYQREIKYMLHTALSELFKDIISEKFNFLNIQTINPNDSMDRFMDSNRTIFELDSALILNNVK